MAAWNSGCDHIQQEAFQFFLCGAPDDLVNLRTPLVSDAERHGGPRPPSPSSMVEREPDVDGWTSANLLSRITAG